MNKQDFRTFWKSEEAIAHIHGWDFSYIEGRYESMENELPWDYKGIIQQLVKPEDRILDIDTGGGEFLLSLKHPHNRTSATEGYPLNVELCKEVLFPLGIDFREMNDYSNMPFADETFDVVINRHGDYDVSEIRRILKPNGLFITQQVGEDNDRALIELLLPGTPKAFPGMNMVCQRQLFEQAGFAILRAEEASRPIRFFDVGALVWFARIIEWEFPGFSVDACFDRLLCAQNELEQTGCIEAMTHRYLIVAQK